MQKFRTLILQRITGVVFLIIFSFSLISLVSRTVGDSYFGKITTSDEVSNFFGSTGSYFSGTTHVFFGYTSYLIPLFFLIIGIKKVLGIKIRFLSIRLISFLFSLFLFCLILKLWANQNGVIGTVLLEIINFHFTFLLINQLPYYLFSLLLLLLAIPILFYGLSLNLKIIIKICKPFIIILLFLFDRLKLLHFKNLFQNSNNLIKKSDSKKEILLNNNEDITKKEPILEKNNNSNNYFKSSINKSYYNKINTNEYIIPPVNLLFESPNKNIFLKEIEKRNNINANRLENILKDFGVTGEITGFKTGPIITLFEFQPSAGIKTSKVIGLADDIARSMSSISARISSQPGKNAIGIEIPNEKKQNVYLGDLLNDSKFELSKSGLILALGKNISGDKIYTDLEKMPHLLIAGTTGSGKSVAINSMILSLLFRYKPSECKLILIDPKMLELSVYENIPHLLTPVVTEAKKAIFALKWVVREMENRYRLMSSSGVKNIESFNSKIRNCISRGKKLHKEVQTGFDQDTKMPIIEKQEIPLDPMPLIVVVIDEMADLMMVAGKEVEHLVQRLAQMARASGIHLIAATQRPSVDVITGTIKANFPSRISFRVASKFDSRTIINEMGAEQLLGSGDMLFLENSVNLKRLHGGYVSEKEIDKVVNFINSQSTNERQTDITSDLVLKNDELNFNIQSENIDELYGQAVSIVVQQQKASVSFIQRHLQIGYNRAARIVEQMEKEGIVSEANHVGKRNVLKKNNE